jgi:glycosyltransferase involved in cell wall biosynthesis
VIHRGIDPRTFDPERIAPERVSSLRTRWGIDPHGRVILQAARLTGWKGQSVLIEAAARLEAAGRLGNAVVVLAGDAQGRTDYLQRLQSQIAGAGLESKVCLVGHVEDMAASYLTAHVTVIASTDPEAFGRTAIEAAAMGSPVIATAIGAPPETVLAEPAVGPGAITGWLVPPGDASALAEHLAEALALGQRERAALAERARTHVLTQFTVQEMQRRTLAVYDRLLGTVLERRFSDRAGGPMPATLLPRQP